MIEHSKQVVEIFKSYSGSNLCMALFFCALIYLWLTKEEKGKKALLVYTSAALAALFFFPPFSYLMLHVVLNEETYYRLLWFLPVGIVIAYSAVRLIARQKKPWRKAAIGVMVCLVLISGGTYTYANPTFERADNKYHIPQTVVDICEEIMPDPGEDWVRAAMPQEFLSYVRQYTTTIYMPYGRAVLIERWNLGHPMHETMEAEVIDTALLAGQAREYGCHYIVLREGRAKDGSLEEQDFGLTAVVDGYEIYLDKDNSLGL